MARKKADKEGAGQEAPPAPAAPAVTKADAVRAAVAHGADVPAEGVAYIKAQFGIDITPQHFSSIKSQHKAKAGKPAGRRGRKPGTPATAAAPTRAAIGIPNVAGPLTTIKHLVETLGVDQVKEIAEIFRK